MEIGSQEWLDFRRKHIMATDLPIIMGVSKWKKPTQLLEEKKGKGKTFVNQAMKRGTELEPVARHMLNEILKKTFEPEMVVSREYPWAAATLDGKSADGTICEIKCPMGVDHLTAFEELVPAHYYPQVQWQIFVCNTLGAWYASYQPQSVEPLVYFWVDRDETYIREMREKASQFYALMENEVVEEPVHELDFGELEEMYIVLKMEEKNIQKELEDVRKKIIEKCAGKKSRGERLGITPVTVRGRVDYTSIPQLSGMDLNVFRKKDTIQWRIEEINPEE